MFINQLVANDAQAVRNVVHNSPDIFDDNSIEKAEKVLLWLQQSREIFVTGVDLASSDSEDALVVHYTGLNIWHLLVLCDKNNTHEPLRALFRLLGEFYECS